MAFTTKTFDYLRDLKANNTREWFEDNRNAYETHWKNAALDVIAEVSEEMANLTPSLKAAPKVNGSLRRINRDVRFSKDKSPYDARLHLVFWSGEHPNRSPAMHFSLQPSGIGYGAGWFGLDTNQLASARTSIRNPARQAGLLSAIDEAKAVGCRMADPDLVRLPRGFEAEGREAELLRYKSFVVRTHDALAPASKVCGPNAKDWLLQTTRTLMPFIAWLDDVKARLRAL